MQLEPAAWRALHVDFHDFGHPVILGMAGPHLGRHVHEGKLSVMEVCAGLCAVGGVWV